MSNIKPPTTVVINDPALHKAVAEVKADTQAIIDALKNGELTQAEKPRYFPKGYFG
jgi:hypothetical protein